MDIPKHKKFSSHLVLTAVLSGGITITFSLIYILLSTAAIIFKFTECQLTSNVRQPFWTLVLAAFIREGDTCKQDIFSYNTYTTPAYTVFVLATIILTVSVLCLVSASVLIATIQDEGATRYLNMAVSAYVGTNVASLVVDLTTAAHFGIDYSTLSSHLDSLPNTNFEESYVIEVLRQGAFLLMSISLKGYVALLINWILIILLIVYVWEHRQLLESAEHSIHKMGILNAFDQPRKPDDNNWATNSNAREPEVFLPFARGAKVNNGFHDDESDRGPRRTPMRSDTNYSNRSYDPSDSWHRGQPNRPFSYLEDIKRPALVPVRPPPSPAVESPWVHRDPWPQAQGPHLPAPDYSPQPRRLKSALKPGGAKVNNGFHDDETVRGPRRTPMRSDTNYSNRSYDPSDSWHRGQPNRPFSFLEDIKRPALVPARHPPSPTVEDPWVLRDPWPQPQGPHVAAADFSPQPRRLKSALKPGGYM